MYIKQKLRLLSLMTFIGLTLILLFTVTGLNSIFDAEKTVHRRQTYTIDLLEIKASALSTILLEPQAQETRIIFATAESNIRIHGDRAINTIKRPEVRRELKNIIDQWNEYDLESQRLIKLSGTDSVSANAQVKPLYLSKFIPLEAAIEQFVNARKADAEEAKSDALKVSRRIYWQSLLVIVFVTCVTIFMAVHLTNSINRGLLGILSKLTPLKEGDLSQRLPTETSDELAKIAIGFNEFIQAVEDAKRIEARLREEKLHLYNATIQGAHHYLNNAVNMLQLVNLETEDGGQVNPATLKQLNLEIMKTQTELIDLGKLDDPTPVKINQFIKDRL